MSAPGLRYSEIAAEFARLGVDVIVTQGTGAIIAAKQATSIIPIVFAAANDPVATGIVASLPQPGVNVTGVSSQAPQTAAKRLQLLREAVTAGGNQFTIDDAGLRQHREDGPAIAGKRHVDPNLPAGKGSRARRHAIQDHFED